MSLYLRLFLLCSSFLFTACLAPKTWLQQNEVPCTISQPIPVNEGERIVYKTDIEVFGRSFGGLLIVAKSEFAFKTSFVSEMGINFFDILINKEDYEVVHCFDAMNNKRFLAAMVRKIRFLIEDPALFEPCRKMRCQTDWVYTVKDYAAWYRQYCVSEDRVKSVSGLNRYGRERVRMHLTYGAENNNRPDQIKTEEKRMRFFMSMKRIDL